MKALRKSEEDSLSKERVTKMSPRDTTKLSPQVVNLGPLSGYATEKNFARPMMLCILNRDLSDGAFRMLCMLSAATWKIGRIALSFDEIASPLGVNVRTAQRQIAELESGGFIRTAKRHNHRNEYEVIGGAVVRQEPVPVIAEAGEPAECPSCSRGLKMTKRGICVACCRDENKVSAWMEAKGQLGPKALPVEIAARVLANKTVKSHKQAAKDAERLEQYEAEWTA